eukprot:9173470-Pyramimonas_sp.AAC.2
MQGRREQRQQSQQQRHLQLAHVHVWQTRPCNLQQYCDAVRALQHVDACRHMPKLNRQQKKNVSQYPTAFSYVVPSS